MDIKDTINFTALSTIVTGSPRKITKEGTAAKYQEDVQELCDLIATWVKWKKAKHG